MSPEGSRYKPPWEVERTEDEKWQRFSEAARRFLLRENHPANDDDVGTWDILEVERWADTVQTPDSESADSGDGANKKSKKKWARPRHKNPMNEVEKRELVADWLATQMPAPRNPHLRRHSHHDVAARVDNVPPLRNARSLQEHELLGLRAIDSFGSASCPDRVGADQEDDRLDVGRKSESEEGMVGKPNRKAETDFPLVSTTCGLPRKEPT